MNLTQLIDKITTLVSDRANPCDIKPVLQTLQERAEALESAHAALKAAHAELKEHAAKSEQQSRETESELHRIIACLEKELKERTGSL